MVVSRVEAVVAVTEDVDGGDDDDDADMNEDDNAMALMMNPPQIRGGRSLPDYHFRERNVPFFF